MARFNIEVELDWVEDINLDEELKNEVIAGIKEHVFNSAKIIADKKITEEVNARAEAVVDDFISKVCPERIEQIRIPFKKSSWDSEIKYIPITEFIGQRFEHYLTQKTLDEHGREAQYSGDRKYSVSEYLVNKMIEKEVTKKVSAMIQKAKQEAEETVIKTLEKNLHEQLAVDTIKRLDVPKLLKSLQDKAAALDTKEAK